jgi:hypothetical protein
METFNIKDVEVFGSGEWNGDKYTEADLEALVSAFKESGLKPYLKIGHGEKQGLLESDELPAAGWIENLRRRGDKLVADFVRVPKKVYELITAGAYRKVSAEIYVNFKHGDKTLPLALKAVSILGAVTPAVSSLQDIINLYDLDVNAKPGSASGEIKAYEYEPTFTEEVMNQTVEKLAAELAEVNKKFAEASAKVEEMAKQDAEAKKNFEAATAKVAELETSIKSEKERADKAEAKVKEYSEAKRDLEITTKVEDLVRKGKLSPAQKDFAIAFVKNGLATGELKFAHGDKEYKSPEELLFAMIEAGAGVTLPTEQKTEAGAAHRDAKDGVVGLETDRKVREYMEKHKVDYKAAYVEISKAQA